MNAIELLETQHRDIDELGDRLLGGEGGTEPRRKAFDDLADLLAIHSLIEEMHFYPALKQAAERTHEALEHSLHEHLEIKRKLALCMVIPLGFGSFRTRFDELMQEVRHHVASERSDVFPIAERLLDADQLEALGQEMVSTMAQLQQGRPRFDVPLQTVAPLPLDSPIAMQGELTSRVMPYLGRFLALPFEMVGLARRGRALLHDLIRRGWEMAQQRRREA